MAIDQLPVVIALDRLPVQQRIKAKHTPVLFSPDIDAAKCFWSFFATKIRNPHTRRAYLNASFRFADWCEDRRIELVQVESWMLGIYIDSLETQLSIPSRKLHLAGLRKLFKWLHVKRIIAHNPATSVDAPKYSVRQGKTPILQPDEITHLFDSIELTNVAAYRDLAILAVMAYSFARVGAIVRLTGKDYYAQGKNVTFNFHEKNDKYNPVPAHHIAQKHVDEYIEVSGAFLQRELALFRSIDKYTQQLKDTPMTTNIVYQMIKRRCAKAGLPPEITCHSFRGTGITNFITNGGTLEMAAKIAGHAKTTTTQLYDRRDNKIEQTEIERVRYTP